MPKTVYDNSGRLFKNDRKRDGGNDPDMTGDLTIGGVKYWVSAWAKEGTEGRARWLSISVKKQGQSADYSTELEKESRGDREFF